MAFEYTSIATAGSLGDALVQQAYDLLVGYNLRTYAAARQFVTKSPSNPSMSGSSIKLTKYSDFSAASITAAKTPLTEEADVDSTKMPAPTTVTVTPAEYGFAVTRTKKLLHRSFADIDPEIARAVAYHLSRVLDELIQDVFITGSNSEYAVTAHSTDNTVVAGEVLTAALVRKQVTLMRQQGVVPWAGDTFVGFVHPQAVHDLRVETGSGGWRVPQEYGVSQQDIWNGSIGTFEGVSFVQNANVRQRTGTNVKVVENYFFGRDAIVESVIEEPHTVLGPVVDRLQRFRHVGWYGDLGWAVYENKALRRVITTTSLQASL